MKKTTTLTLGAVTLMALATACNMEVGDAPVEDIGTAEEAVSCGNEEGVASVMAAMAVASAMEMRRWLPERDMTISNWRLALTSYAWPRCPNRNCQNMYALLQLQDDSANGMIVGGQPLWAPTLRDRINTYWGRQRNCIIYGGGNCLAPVYKPGQPAEYHDFTFLYKSPSSCGSDFHFHACKQGTNCTELEKPGSLKNNLIWAGAPENQYLNFYNNGSYVRIDPTNGLITDDTTTSGSCTVACTKQSQVDLTGQCCTCNGMNKTFARKSSTMPTWFVCN